jgi:nanoRNase/pAp phosphatase (c-di-AMP/oligoRNAs hydrolase)
MKKKRKWWYLGVGTDPWRRSRNQIHLGMFMRQYGGGGHKDIGAAEFATKEQALKAFDEINAMVNC